MKARHKRRSQVRKAITQVTTDVEHIWHLDRPPICQLHSIHQVLIEQYEELGRFDKEVESTVDINRFEAEMEEANFYERQNILVKGRTE